MGDAAAVLEYDGDVNAIDSNGYTPLHKAIVHGQHAVVRQLLKMYTLDTEKESCGFTPLYAAAVRDGKL